LATVVSAGAGHGQEAHQDWKALGPDKSLKGRSEMRCGEQERLLAAELAGDATKGERYRAELDKLGAGRASDE